MSNAQSSTPTQADNKPQDQIPSTGLVPKQSDQDSRLDADPQPSQGICSCDTGDHLGGILYDLKGRYILAENQLHAIGQSRHKSLHGALSAVWEASQAWAHSSCTGDVKDRKSAHTKLTAELSDLNASLHILKDQDGLEDTKLCIDKVNTLQGVSSTVEALDEVYPESAACFWRTVNNQKEDAKRAFNARKEDAKRAFNGWTNDATTKHAFSGQKEDVSTK